MILSPRVEQVRLNYLGANYNVSMASKTAFDNARLAYCLASCKGKDTCDEVDKVQYDKQYLK